MTTLQELMQSVPEMAGYNPYGERMRPGDELRQIGFGMMSAGGKPGSTGLGALGDAGLGVIDTEQGIAERGLRATNYANSERLNRFQELSALARAEEEARQNAERMRLQERQMAEQDVRERMANTLRQQQLEQEASQFSQNYNLDRAKAQQASVLGQMADKRAARGQDIDERRLKQALELAAAQDNRADTRLEREYQLRSEQPTDVQRNISALQRLGLGTDDALAAAIPGLRPDRVELRQDAERRRAQRDMDALYGGLSQDDVMEKRKDDPMFNEFLRRGATWRQVRETKEQIGAQLAEKLVQWADLPPAEFARRVNAAREMSKQYGLSQEEFDAIVGGGD